MDKGQGRTVSGGEMGGCPQVPIGWNRVLGEKQKPEKHRCVSHPQQTTTVQRPKSFYASTVETACLPKAVPASSLGQSQLDKWLIGRGK